MWWPFGKRREATQAIVDAGGGYMVDLRPLAEEAFLLRPHISHELRQQALPILIDCFNTGKTSLKLKQLGFSRDDADFISNRVMKWAFWERDATNRAYLASQKYQYFKGVELKPEGERCSEAASSAKKLFPLDQAPRIPFASCDQTTCRCMIAVVSPGIKKAGKVR